MTDADGVSATARVHLIADDLTGALDTAAQFTGITGPIPVYWDSLPATSRIVASIAIDSATREVGRGSAQATVALLASGLPRPSGTIFYAKLDSLLRGHAGAEIAAWLAALSPAHCIVAPAFPFQGRVTRNGVQLARTPSGWQPTQIDLCGDLRREAVEVTLCRPGDPVPPGVSLWDAETDDDLAAIAAAGLALDGTVLWCGSSGLAGALATVLGRPARAGREGALPGPVLGLFGTNHPVTVGQLAACGDAVMALPDGGEASAAAVTRRLTDRGVALVNLDLPAGLPRGVAARRIDEEFTALVRRLDPPASLLVAGGETLRTLCFALEAERLDLDGHILPGVPRSILRGGRFDGVRVVSKSGAFGEPDLLRRLLAHNESTQQGVEA